MKTQGFTPGNVLEYLFLDLNSYFASVEQQENPALRGRPVAVVPMMTDATCAIAASYEAKAFGIKTGTKIYDAKKLCPQLTLVLARHDLYVDYHHRIFEAVAEHIPIEKTCSVDEVLCRLLQKDRTPERASSVARHLKDILIQTIGPAIKCSIGIAPTGFLAKTASNMQKPDGLTILQPGQLKDPICRLKLTDLTGINRNMERRLNQAGIFTVEQFWNIAPKHARQIWGGVGGERFWYKLHGYEIPDIKTKKRVIGHSRMLDPALRPPDRAREISRQLTYKAATRLRRYEMFCGRLGLSVRTPDYRRWGGESSFAATQDSFKMLERLDTLWQRMLLELKPQSLLKVSINLVDLEDAAQVTPDLLEDYLPGLTIATPQNNKLCQTIDQINQKLGANTVTIGMPPKTRAGFVGTKIAFNRIPTREEFFE